MGIADKNKRHNVFHMLFTSRKYYIPSIECIVFSKNVLTVQKQ